ncbi:MAG: cell division ATP-binding protein FtsE [Gammaproteobacteria bacterium RIFOXYB2_FULL_38_6]|nr:MAG: cell division ATP-binding protein FtsE [Gammaproteobacteria bacterium RIFOXYB2_FULL_38_6]
MIRFVNVTKKYPFGHVALNQVNFHLEKGEMAFLTGHSGAGKTTLLKLMMLIERPSRGQVYLDNKCLNKMPRRNVPYFRRKIGMVYQDSHLLLNRTVYENVAMPLIVSDYSGKDMKSRVSAALDKVGLLHQGKKYPMALSSGEQQRVGIARAIVNRPPLILADEPTGNLDPGLSAEIMKLFETLNDVGITLLIASHDLNLIASMRHRILTLKQGVLISGGDDE